MNAPSPCPDERTFRDYVAGRLDEDRSRAVRDHLNACPDCRGALDRLVAEAMNSPVVEGTLSDETRTAGRPAEGDERSIDDEYTLDLSFLDLPTQDGSLGRIGEHEVLAGLGEGGMGVVFKAFDKTLHRMVAIKVLAPRLASSQGARRRFIREARAAAAINHPNVITIHSVSVQQEMPYLVMEYIAGTTLHHRIREGPPLEVEEALRIAVQVASGLAAAHEQGVIHRDIKPANIMLEDGVERVKITDFGLALAAIDSPTITSAGQMVGTPSYMSPEQVRAAGAIDSRSDLFSLGCVLYAMFVGHSPFRGQQTLEVIRLVSEFHPPPLHEVCPRVPRALSEVVRRLLEKNPKDRFQTASELAVVLKQQLAAAHAARSEGGDRRPGAWPGRPPLARTTRLVTAAAMLALVAAAVAWWRWKAPTAGVAPRPLVAATPSPSAPPKPPAPPKPAGARPGILTVGRETTTDFRTIGEAIAAAGPGATIRIVDGEAYPEELWVGDAARHRDLTIESPRRATLEPPPGSPSGIRVEDTPGVTIRGLAVRAGPKQHGVQVSGQVDGLRLEDLSVALPHGSHRAAVHLRGGPQGLPGRPIVLRGLAVDCGTLGVAIFGTNGRPASWVVLEDSRVNGRGVLLLLDTAVTDVTITRNLFFGGRTGISLNLKQPGQSARVAIRRNTFYDLQNWITFADTSLEQGEIEVGRNLILKATGVLAGGQDLAQAAGAWFRGNVWESCPGIDEGRAGLLAELRPAVPVASTDPGDRDFLVPAAAAGAASGGVEGDLSGVGAGPVAVPGATGGGGVSP
jgi:eukaryotic-like serine/threonine-protein kinase